MNTIKTTILKLSIYLLCQIGITFYGWDDGTVFIYYNKHEAGYIQEDNKVLLYEKPVD